MEQIIRAPALCGNQEAARPKRTAELKLRLINLGAVTIPFAGLVLAIVLLWGVAVDRVYLGIFGGMGLYHRYFRHNHHRGFPTSARHGLAWWQIDVSYLIIRAMGNGPTGRRDTNSFT